jgi:peptide/nickel transport system ATP-binding protein
MALLNVENLSTTFHTSRGDLRAVNDLSFSVSKGETVAIVGESGSGKSVSALSIMRLLDESRCRLSGKVELKGQDILSANEAEMRAIRGNQVGLIFQEPMTALNPVVTVGRQVAESARLHEAMTRRQAAEKAIEMLTLVGIPDPRRRAGEYPHQLSGGMRQRVMIAMALICQPELLIADEPTTALDVTVQAQILDLMRSLREQFGSAIILITHDLGVVAEMADRVIIMYAGRKLEEGTAEEIFAHPKHPYTKGLLGAVPRLGSSLEGKTERLVEIEGSVPDPRTAVVGCAFAPRCCRAADICRLSPPVLIQSRHNHEVACHFVGEMVGA